MQILIGSLWIQKSYSGLSLSSICFSSVLYVFSFTFLWINEGYEFFTFCYSQVFWLEQSSLCDHWKGHADILFRSECVFLFFSFFWRADSRFKAALYGQISLLKCDKEWLWIPELVWVPIFIVSWLFFSLWPGTRLAEQHFRVFPSSSDQFKVISARSGRKKEREWRGGGGKGFNKPLHYEGKGTLRLNTTIS